jgi:Big-like domain-containing protein
MPIPDSHDGVSATAKPDAKDDSLTYRVADHPPEGAVTINQADGTFTYTPSLDAEDPGRRE